MKKKLLVGLTAGVFVFGHLGISHANLIKNESFENVSSSATGQGILPDDWVNIPPPTPTADTYSNDGSYGLSPNGYGNFTGVTAYDGIRWVAGASSYGQESFGQWLDDSLTEGADYDFSGWLHQAVRSDLNYAGGYEIYLTNTPGVQSEYLGFLGSTTSVGEGWNQYSFSFTVSEAMASLTFLEFAPIVTATTGSAYPGLDFVFLEEVATGPGPGPGPAPVPEPATMLLFGTGLVGLAGSRLRRKKK